MKWHGGEATAGTVVADLAVKQQTFEALALPETDIAPKDDGFQ